MRRNPATSSMIGIGGQQPRASVGARPHRSLRALELPTVGR
jgi:hypothetical protein